MRWTTPRWSVASSGVASAITLLEQFLGFVFRIWKQPEDLAEVGAAGAREFQAIGLGPAVSLFVRVDFARAERLEFHATHKPAASQRLPFRLKQLVINVNRGPGVFLQHSFAPPVLQKAGRPGVFVVSAVVAGLLAVEDQPHDVAGVLLIQGVLQVLINHVVRRGDHIAQRADVPQVITQAAEGFDIRHLLIAECGFRIADWASAERVFIPNEGEIVKPRSAGGGAIDVAKTTTWRALFWAL
jgi:hypothetical protein